MGEVDTISVIQWPGGCSDTISCYHKGRCISVECKHWGEDIDKTIKAKVIMAPYPDHQK